MSLDFEDLEPCVAKVLTCLLLLKASMESRKRPACDDAEVAPGDEDVSARPAKKVASGEATLTYVFLSQLLLY
jgi:hypothetical protein